MSVRTHFKWRLSIAIVAGLLISGICLTNIRPVGYMAGYAQYFSVSDLQFVDEQIKLFRTKNRRLPRSLNELSKAPYELSDGYLSDSWNHPLVYAVHGEKYTLVSYGMDGKPGGVGLDHDLTAASPKNNLPEPTFWQLFFHPLSIGVHFSSAFCGLFTFLLTLFITRRPDSIGDSDVNLPAKLFFTLLGASIVAFFITTFHVPSGH